MWSVPCALLDSCRMSNQLFPALLRYWRRRRGLSQLDLSIEAEVSARHLSFLESGRARPSTDMALRLLSALHVPLHAQNEALRAAGLPPRFPEPGLGAIDPYVQQALVRMMNQQEPFPLTVLGIDFALLHSNRAAQSIFRAFVAEPSHMPASPDMFTLFFDPRLLRPFVLDWATFARSMLVRLQREMLQRGEDERLRRLLDRVLAFPGVPASWRHPDFSLEGPCAQLLRLRRDTLSVGFLIAITKFSSPRQVILDELSVESCFPLDEATRATCERIARGRSPNMAASTAAVSLAAPRSRANQKAPKTPTVA
jgi:transcriptional regulator with XRE-family HTH domain